MPRALAAGPHSPPALFSGFHRTHAAGSPTISPVRPGGRDGGGRAVAEPTRPGGRAGVVRGRVGLPCPLLTQKFRTAPGFLLALPERSRAPAVLPRERRERRGSAGERRGSTFFIVAGAGAGAPGAGAGAGAGAPAPAGAPGAGARYLLALPVRKRFFGDRVGSAISFGAPGRRTRPPQSVEKMGKK